MIRKELIFKNRDKEIIAVNATFYNTGSFSFHIVENLTFCKDIDFKWIATQIKDLSW